VAKSPLTRAKLSAVFKSPELVRAFDDLFRTAADVGTLQAQLDAQAIVITAMSATIGELQAELEIARSPNLSALYQQLDELRTLLLAS
jgi:hypothetical protein